MGPNQGIIFILMFLILIICYFAPIGVEGFSNIRIFNPQGSYRSSDTFNPGPQVDQYKIGKGIVEPGTLDELNMESVSAQFPYYKFMPEHYKDGQISLFKPDGVIVGGYVPQIIRPFDTVSATPPSNSSCKWPCYSDTKFQKWCSEDNAVNYHAMRPLVSPGKYNNNLRKLFAGIIDKEVNVGMPDKNKGAYQAVFCTETQKSIMSWLMQKIASQVKKMPEMQRNGSWKYEMFYDTDALIYQTLDNNKNTYFRIVFNLFNPLRSVSTMVSAIVFIDSGKPKLLDISFINNESMDDYINTPYGVINGHNVNNSFESVGGGIGIIQPELLGYDNTKGGVAKFEKDYMKNPNEFNWNYMNTLVEQKFNKEGFYSNVPGDNLKIEGGVPEGLKKALRTSNCKETNLMSCVTPEYTGVNAGVSGSKIVKNDGEVHNVYSDPTLIYTNKNPLSLRSIETVNGNVYI